MCSYCYENVRPSVCLSVCLSVCNIGECDHIHWHSRKVISRINRDQGNPSPTWSPKLNISEQTGYDSPSWAEYSVNKGADSRALSPPTHPSLRTVSLLRVHMLRLQTIHEAMYMCERHSAKNTCCHLEGAEATANSTIRFYRPHVSEDALSTVSGLTVASDKPVTKYVS